MFSLFMDLQKFYSEVHSGLIQSIILRDTETLKFLTPTDCELISLYLMN